MVWCCKFSVLPRVLLQWLITFYARVRLNFLVSRPIILLYLKKKTILSIVYVLLRNYIDNLYEYIMYIVLFMLKNLVPICAYIVQV